MDKKRFIKLGIFLLVVGACFALDAGLGMFGSTLLIAMAGAGAAGEPEPGKPPELVTLPKEQLQDLVKNAMTEFSNEMGLKDIANSFKPAATPTEDSIKKELMVKNSAYGLHSILCAMNKYGNNHDAIKNDLTPLNITTDATGKYLVPTTIVSSIIDIVRTVGQARQLFNVMPTPNGAPMKLPYQLTKPTAYLVGEKAAKTEGTTTFGQIDLTVRNLAAYVVLTKEFLQDATVEMGQWVTAQIAEAIAYLEDYYAFLNDNTYFNGLFYSGNSFGNTVNLTGADYSTMTWKNLVKDMLRGIDQAKLAGASVNMHRTVFGEIESMTDSNKRPLFLETPAGVTFKGLPVNLIEQAPTGYTGETPTASTPLIITGNLKKNSFFRDVAGMQIELLKEATLGSVNLAEYGLVAIMITKRFSVNAGVTGNYSIIKTGAGT